MSHSLCISHKYNTSTKRTATNRYTQTEEGTFGELSRELCLLRINHKRAHRLCSTDRSKQLRSSVVAIRIASLKPNPYITMTHSKQQFTACCTATATATRCSSAGGGDRDHALCTCQVSAVRSHNCTQSTVHKAPAVLFGRCRWGEQCMRREHRRLRQRLLLLVISCCCCCCWGQMCKVGVRYKTGVFRGTRRNDAFGNDCRTRTCV